MARRGGLPLWFLPRVIAQESPHFFELIDRLCGLEGGHVAAASLGEVAPYGRFAECDGDAGLLLFPLRAGERQIGLLSCDDGHLLPQTVTTISIWSRLLATYMMPDTHPIPGDQLEILTQRYRQFALESVALSDAGRTLLGYTRVDRLASAVSRLAAELGEAPYVALYTETPEASFTRAGVYPQDGAPPFALGLHDVRTAMANGAPVLDPTRHVLLVPFGERGAVSERPELRACLVLVRSAESPPFAREHLRMLESFSTLGALALRNVRLYEEAWHANEALAESNAFKDDLLAMFAHDFKGPLTVIAGYGEFILERLQGEDRESLGMILSQVSRLARLADDALTLARTQARGFVVVPTMNDLVRFVEEVVETSFGPTRARLQVRTRERAITCPFDANALRHVLENVIGNALKYSSALVDIEVSQERHEAIVAVRDRGIGIPAEELAGVFGRFSRATNARRQGISGSGVGLYVAHRIVEAHGGSIFVSSSEGEGSTFEVRLPLNGVAEPATEEGGSMENDDFRYESAEETL